MVVGEGGAVAAGEGKKWPPRAGPEEGGEVRRGYRLFGSTRDSLYTSGKVVRGLGWDSGCSGLGGVTESRFRWFYAL